MNDNSHEPDRGRRSFLFDGITIGSIILTLFMWFLQWIIHETMEIRRKQNLEQYKASPIYPYKKD